MSMKQGPAAAVVGLESLESRAYFAAGALDPTFGNGGTVTTDFTAPGLSQALAAVALPDGKVIAVGRASTSMGMTRFLADGRVDASFGTGGQVFADFGGAFVATDALRLADGKILVAGVGEGGVVIARFTVDGALDPTFGSGGKAVATPQPHYTARVAVGPDGTIVVAAKGQENGGGDANILVARLTAAGAVDATFGNNGSVEVDFGFYDTLAGVAVRPSGRILVAGSYAAQGLARTGITLVQFAADGRPDTSFGGGTGRVAGNIFAGGDDVTDMALDSLGRILLADSGHNQGAPSVARFRADGVFDRSFAQRGVRRLDLSAASPGGSQSSRIALQGDGKIVLMNEVHYSDNNNPGIQTNMVFARLTAGGAIDTTFSADGLVSVPLGFHATAGALAIGPTGRIIGAGSADDEMALVRLTPGGAVEPTADASALATARLLGSSTDRANAMIRLADGSLIVAGSSEGTDGRVLAIARYRPDGSLDTTFGDDGRVRKRVAGGDHEVTSVIQIGNVILVACSGGPSGGLLLGMRDDGVFYGTFGAADGVPLAGQPLAMTAVGGDKFVVLTRGSGGVLELRRYAGRGALDRTFGSDGVVKLPGIAVQSNNTLITQPDGKILIAGSTNTDPDGYHEFYTVWRLTPSGALDATFGSSGKAQIDVGGLFTSYPRAMALQKDGKILVAGERSSSFGVVNGGPGAITLARLNANGTLDASFGDRGVVMTQFLPPNPPVMVFGTDSARAIAIQDDGRIVVAAEVHVAPQDGAPTSFSIDWGLIRYNPDGSLDNGFGTRGKLLTTFGRDDVPSAALITPDGKLIVAGTGEPNATAADFALARYLLDDPNAITARVENGVLKITGTDAGDTIRLRTNAGKLTIDGASGSFALSTFSRIEIAGKAGNDLIDGSLAIVPMFVDGGAGNDSILGGSADDSLLGGVGHDTLFGGKGRDILRGGDGNDYLSGGRDTDQLFGDAGNDQIFAVDSHVDTLDGGPGFDRVKADADDLLAGTEGLLS